MNIQKYKAFQKDYPGKSQTGRGGLLSVERTVCGTFHAVGKGGEGRNFRVV